MCVCDEEAAASNHKTQIPLGKLWQLKPALSDELFIYLIVIFFSDGSLSRRWPMLCFS
jgi:hypothetical protein